MGDEVLVNSTGTGTLGRAVALRGLPPGLPWFADSHVTLLRVDKRHADPRFLGYVLGLRSFGLYAEDALSVGATKQRELNVELVRRHTIGVPALNVQRVIANFLDRESDRIGELDSSLIHINGLLHENFRRELLQLVGKIPHVALKRWAQSISDGPFGSALASKHYVETPGVRVIRLGDIGDAEIRDSQPVYVADDYASGPLADHRVRSGDVVMAGLGDGNHPVGRAAVVPSQLDGAIHKADCYRIVLDGRRADPEFVALSLTLGQAHDRALVLARGSTRARLNTVVAGLLPVPALSLADQRKTVRQLGSRRALASETHDRVAALSSRLTLYRDALITEAVTGQLDVTKISEAEMDERARAAAEGSGATGSRATAER